MGFLLYFFMSYLMSFVFLYPVFELMQPKEEGAILASLCASFIVAVIVALLLQIKDGLIETNKLLSNID